MKCLKAFLIFPCLGSFQKRFSLELTVTTETKPVLGSRRIRMVSGGHSLLAGRTICPSYKSCLGGSMAAEYGGLGDKRWRSLIQVERRGYSHGFSISMIGVGYNDLRV